MGIKLEDKDFKYISSSLYAIMTINMNVKNPEKGAKAPTAAERRELVISAIKDFPASVIFCQEVPSKLEEEVEKNFGPGVYEFAFTEFEAAVMWRKSVFKGDRQFLEGNDPSSIKITERLKQTKSDVDVSEVHTRTAMVKLTSVETGASFLAVSWHGASKPAEITRLKALNGLICFLYEVCKDKLSSCIIGGDFNLDTSTVVLTKHKDLEVTISLYELSARDKNRLAQPPKRGRRFIPYKDTFIISVTLPSYKHPMTGDITVPLVRPLEPENETGDHNLMDHVPVGGVLKLACVPCKKPYTEQDRDTVTEDTSDKTTSEKERPGLTPEPEGRTSTRGPRNSGVQKKLEFKGNEENVTRDEKKRHSSGKVEVKENESIEVYVKNLGKRIERVQGDGHCMLHALSLGLKEKDGQGDYSEKSLLTKIKKELSDNCRFYSEFCEIKEEDLKAFIEQKKYDSSVVDLIPYVVANITNTEILISHVENGKVGSISQIPPRNMESGTVGRTIYVCKIGNHYDAILDEKAASGFNIEASTSGYVTREDFERLFDFVERSFKSIDAKINTLTAEVAEIKLAIKSLDGSHGSDSQAQPTEAHSQTTKISKSPVQEQGSDRETFTKDTSDKTTNEKDRPGLTPETTAGTAKVGSRVSDAQRKLKLKDEKSILPKSQPPSFGPVKKDGTPDMGYAPNKSRSSSSSRGPLKKDGTTDMRYKANWR